MALEIAYFTYSSKNPRHFGKIVSSETRTLSATSALAGETPRSADVVRITANGEAARFDYSSATSDATATSPYLPNGDTIELDAVTGWKVAGRTA